MSSYKEQSCIILLVVFTRHSYEITPLPTAMVLKSQRDIHSLLGLTKIVDWQWEENLNAWVGGINNSRRSRANIEESISHSTIDW